MTPPKHAPCASCGCPNGTLCTRDGISIYLDNCKNDWRRVERAFTEAAGKTFDLATCDAGRAKS